MSQAATQNAEANKAANWGHGAMLLFSIIVAGAFALGGRIVEVIDPAALTAFRFLVSSVVIGAVAAISPGIKGRDFQSPWRYLVLGALMACYFVLMFEGLKVSPAVSISAVFTLTPIMSALFGWILLRQITTTRMALALTIGAMGAVWVIFRADVAALLAFEIGRGEAVFLIGCAAHALYTPLVRYFNRGEAPIVFTTGMLIGGALILSVYAGQDLLATDFTKFDAFDWGIIAYLCFASTGLTFFLVQFAVLRLPASKVMAYTYFTPAVVIVWEGALGLGWPQLAILGGVGLTVLALLILLKNETPL